MSVFTDSSGVSALCLAKAKLDVEGTVLVLGDLSKPSQRGAPDVRAGAAEFVRDYTPFLRRRRISEARRSAGRGWCIEPLLTAG